jgi:hypothetical protein
VLAERPLADCVKALRVNKIQFLGAPTAKVQLGRPEDPLAAVKGFAQVLVLVVEPEATAHGWKPGYYLAPVTPQQAAERLKAKLPAA